MSEIDWKTELRKIEREYDGLPPEPSPALARAQKAAALRAKQQTQERFALVAAWARLLLVAGLAAALWWWPYAHACGVDLGAFLGAQGMVLVGGIWAAVYTWRHRLALTHGVAVLLAVAGLALLTVQVLPRAGYARISGVQADAWRCALDDTHAA